jgi:hypothetical protein
MHIFAFEMFVTSWGVKTGQGRHEVQGREGGTGRGRRDRAGQGSCRLAYIKIKMAKERFLYCSLAAGC